MNHHNTKNATICAIYAIIEMTLGMLMLAGLVGAVSWGFLPALGLVCGHFAAGFFMGAYAEKGR